MQTPDDSKKFTIIQLSIAALIFLIYLGDRYVYKLYVWAYYEHVVAAAVGLVSLSAWLTHKKIVSCKVGFELTILVLYAYPAIFMYQFDFSDVFAFMQTFLFIAVIYPGGMTRFLLILALGVIVSNLTVSAMPEPDLVKEGRSLKPFLLNVLQITGIVGVMVFWFFNRQRTFIDQLSKRFIAIGRE